MSAITSEQVAHLAMLAHIEMTDEELAAMAAELDVIVESVKSVSDAVSDDIPATSHPIPLKNVFRDDVVGETLTAEEALSGAPDAEDGKFKVPAILDED
ncbi:MULTISPECIES: Asp-tRNA(Asn)/Glu-tRNA(Gln) amidotransferase subunit GatC [Rothia]|uniref:Aspartyl/glutamyl-tRNA(Asn/Gln) amidotransferase subunit C n=3 Tax=Rothia TaxID=32207 RepID=A0A1Y1RN04_9MICC|nr:Asp-tRNA(Asn)/Glu-tRNA(Gln) amidotransferase subunit GatC [Rothia nasimurium]MDO4821788.1 Asp-tRNA(Asn)/Glu-tRNA(Gln) amidotransferase subunit GatC [Rothia sp. (in: high G+C Gram-positive bacteria)]ORC15498.1 asparaginyl/glutamyl-tRNA amidotransferase subunit C [Rothia nasimurium]HIY94269.1 Asp-tRNA(Asn)/Glu-tRNA(Gln) amidotransferase subunit GatC [Candidatus Rothia avicola]HJD50636.1 Asp-tRNA(Asn)/Glu-tRNA(Gln) amidotransferase subunit GatC [Candidatus Rothia avistercoris]